MTVQQAYKIFDVRSDITKMELKKRAVQHKSYFDTYPENQANRLGEKVTRLKSPGKITA